MIPRCEYPICIKITEEAVKQCRKLFDRLPRMEIECELTYYIRKHEEAGSLLRDSLKLNLDYKRTVLLKRVDERKWEVAGFESRKEEKHCGQKVTGNNRRKRLQPELQKSPC